MSETLTYIHGTEPPEQNRLRALNRLTNSAFVRFLDVRPGMRVLEVGSGLGLLAVEVANSASGVQVVGIEQSPAQIAASVKNAVVRYVQGDAHRLQFEDGTFDLVYARYVLEHLADPQVVLTEMRRVVRPCGRVAVCENDISLLRLDPPCPIFMEVWEAFQQHQRNLGGDSQIGRRLYQLFRNAGFLSIELSVQPEVHWHGSPTFATWMENLIGNIESARHGLINSQLCSEEHMNAAIAELRSHQKNEDASSLFMWNRAAGIRHL